jgi:hypothetical protein
MKPESYCELLVEPGKNGKAPKHKPVRDNN